MKSILISFATNPKWYRAQTLLNNTGKAGNLTGCISYTDKSKQWEFMNKYKDVYSTRGFGYWQWKPLIVLDAMNQVDNGDIIVYVDSGNLIVKPLDYIIDHCKANDITLFDNRDGEPTGRQHINCIWTKRDCFTLMSCDTPAYHNAPQVNASYQLYKKTPRVMEFLEEYKKWCSDDRVISDDPNTTLPNLNEFKDHRHDQSILTNLAVKHKISLLPDPSEWGSSIPGRPYDTLFLHHRGTL